MYHKVKCPECQRKGEVMEDVLTHDQSLPEWEVEFKKVFAEYAEHKRLAEPAYIIWAVEFIKKLLKKEL